MAKNKPPIFGENGTILNADEMQPQSEWPKPEPQGITRKQWMRILFVVALSLAVTTANMYWQIF